MHTMVFLQCHILEHSISHFWQIAVSRVVEANVTQQSLKR